MRFLRDHNFLIWTRQVLVLLGWRRSMRFGRTSAFPN